MSRSTVSRDLAGAPVESRAHPFREMTRLMLRKANEGGRRIEFLQESSALILASAQCEALEIRLSDRDLHYHWQAPGDSVASQFTIVDSPAENPGQAPGTPDPLETVCRVVLSGAFDRTCENATSYGSIFTGDTHKPLVLCPASGEKVEVILGGRYPSVAIIPFAVEVDSLGLLLLKSSKRNFINRDRAEYFEAIAQYLGLAVANRRAQAALRERVKEITCLYGLALLSEQDHLSQHEFLQSAVELLPPAWQFPELACAQIQYDGQTYRTRRFGEALHTQSAPIVIDDDRRGTVEVQYFRSSPEFGRPVFLPEERHLIDAVASQLTLALERRQTEHQRLQLEAQLRHADRLATVGQLAAGVAHELNEPLGNILGLAQLLSKAGDLPVTGQSDVAKIIAASLHAREIIRSLMLFARQTPPQKVISDLNELVEDSLGLVEARSAKAGVTLALDLASNLPGVEVDPVQIRQVVVNLAVNAVQAMPNGGTLTVTTRIRYPWVILRVKDTGTGMTDHVKRRLFMPFFTTKSQEGTGLGLSVTHGIVMAHGGSIGVESTPGEGSEFEVLLPIHAAHRAGEDTGEYS